ncbi:MAG: aminotransferase class V-fold PLP-dependent enzyme [Dehalococcoidia bacterium]
MECTRRAFLDLIGVGTVVPAVVATHQPPTAGPGTWRAEFPALGQTVNGHPLAYLDSAATTLRPRAVIDAVTGFYERDNANPSATLHTLARRSAEQYGAARARVARFLNAASAGEIVVTKGTTEAINLVATAWGAANVHRGDEIVLTVAEHYSNLLPWRGLAERAGARVVTVDVDDDGRVDPARIDAALTPRTKLVAFSHVSNVLGLVNPAEAICQVARRRQVPVLIDAAQSAPHVALDVQALGCDFLACSGHKILGPMGTGILWARQGTLDAMPPYHLGSNMAHEVEATSAVFEHGGAKYQAGTPNVSGTIGLAAATDVLARFDLTAIRRHDADLVRHFRDRAASVPGLRVLGTLEKAEARVPVFTFTLAGVPVGEVVKQLDAGGVAVRAGDMAALPLLRRFGVTEAVRASCYLYTTTEEIDRMADVLRRLARRG